MAGTVAVQCASSRHNVWGMVLQRNGSIERVRNPTVTFRRRHDIRRNVRKPTFGQVRPAKRSESSLGAFMIDKDTKLLQTALDAQADLRHQSLRKHAYSNI